MIKNKMIFLIVGYSCCGKDTIANELRLKHNYKLLKSYTTREIRQNNHKDKDTHIFIKPSQLHEYEKDIVAYTKIGDAVYFATKQQILQSDLYIIDPEGIQFLRTTLKQDKEHAIIPRSIYINVPFQERLTRSLNRGDTKSDFYKRYAKEAQRFQYFTTHFKFDYAVPNFNLQKCLLITDNIIRTEQAT